MKDLFSYNLVTLLNCGKVKALTGKSLYNCNFYDVSFLELEELEIENVIKAVGLYPVPFFSLKLAERTIHVKEAQPIKNLWQSIHIANHVHTTSHALTVTSQVNKAHDLHQTLCLTDEHWSLLHAKPRDDISVIRHCFMRVGSLDFQNNLPPPVANQLAVPVEKLLQSRLPHDIVAALTGLAQSFVKSLRECLISEGRYISKTFVQKRVLERHSFDRFALFIAFCYFELQLALGVSPILAFLKTIEAFDHSPTVQANKSDEFHFAVNLFHWLTVHGYLTSQVNQKGRAAALESFPENFLEYFDLEAPKRIPPIRNMGLFTIPQCLDLEHQRLLSEINLAISNKACLKTVIERYYEGAFE